VVGQKIVHFYTIRLERIPDLRVVVAPGTKGKQEVAGKEYLTRQAATLLKLARSTKDPQIAAGLVEKADDLKSQVDSAPDRSPHAPDVEV